jgi:hypothetical protein
MFGLIHEPRQFLELRSELIGDMPPGLACAVAIGLAEGLADGGGDDAATLADFQMGGVEPKIGPAAFKGAVEEGVHALVDLFAEQGYPGHIRRQNERPRTFVMAPQWRAPR